jgi:hypothetical protein
MTGFSTLKHIVAVAATVILTGCIGMQPTPNFARSGDVVSISLGGFKRNVGGR